MRRAAPASSSFFCPPFFCLYSLSVAAIRVAAFFVALVVLPAGFITGPLLTGAEPPVNELHGGDAMSDVQDVLLLGPPGVGKSFLVQALGYQAVRAGFAVLYRSIFDVIRDFLQDEALGGDDKVLAR